VDLRLEGKKYHDIVLVDDNNVATISLPTHMAPTQHVGSAQQPHTDPLVKKIAWVESIRLHTNGTSVGESVNSELAWVSGQTHRYPLTEYIQSRP
jgi:hypothetical protein